jgi:DNA-binding NarL/FixJ family response regulator
LAKLRILIADDHGLIRRAVRTVLQARRGWKIVGEAANGREAVEKAIKLKPDVAIVDISMSKLDGVEVTRQIRESVPAVKVLVLTMHESDQMVRRALDAGANGYLLKSDLTDYLPKAVKAIAEEGRPTGSRITPREMEIIRLLAEGKSNSEVDIEAINLSPKVVVASRKLRKALEAITGWRLASKRGIPKNKFKLIVAYEDALGELREALMRAILKRIHGTRPTR